VAQDCARHDQGDFLASASHHRSLYDAVVAEVESLSTRLRDKATETPAFGGSSGAGGLAVQLREASEVVAIESRLALWSRLRNVLAAICRFE
jgi:hypothetical protein